MLVRCRRRSQGAGAASEYRRSYRLHGPDIPRQCFQEQIFGDRADSCSPDRRALDVSLLEKPIGPLGRADRSLGAMLVDQELGGALDVQVGDHIV